MVYSAAVISFNNLSIFQSIFSRENTRNATQHNTTAAVRD